MKMPEPFIHYRHYDEQVQPFADENTVPLYDKQAMRDLLEAAISAISKDEIRGKVLPFGINPPSEGLSLGQEWALEAAQAAIRSMKGKL
jgi:hypothetical protein